MRSPHGTVNLPVTRRTPTNTPTAQSLCAPVSLLWVAMSSASQGGGEATTVERWVSLSADARRCRNLCVLAHVDHGKTTLSDCLIAHNGLIHPKMVGKLRYMDFRDDEQARSACARPRCVTSRSPVAECGACRTEASP